MNVPTVLERPAARSRRPAMPRWAGTALKHGTLLFVGLAVAYPFYFMVTSGLKEFAEATLTPPTLFPQELHFPNFAEAWAKAPWPRYFLNTVLVASATTAGILVTSVLAAYAFAQMQFKGRAVAFTVLLATYMMPAEATLIPNFLLMSRRYLNLYDTYLALILPFLASAFAIFLLRQQFRGIPQELRDAARIDGAGHLRYLWSVVLPLSVPALVTLGVISFLASWNSFQWPLIMTSRPDIQPVQVGLNAFRGETGSHYHLLMAASAFVVAPVVLLYLVAQRYLVQGVARTGIRG
ncbi:MAG: carbohydrate ABC transporter permease [Chloroflexi bacterium]|nr:carbohydrate ABC transporter permease [Chloroflexota bacterium]